MKPLAASSSLEEMGSVISRRVFLRIQMWVLPSAPVLAYILPLMMGFQNDEAVRMMLFLLPPIIVFLGVGWTYFGSAYLVRRAIRTPPKGSPTARLERLLALPQKVVIFCFVAMAGLGGLIFLVSCCLLLGKSLSPVLFAEWVLEVYTLLVGVLLVLSLEADLLPLVRQEALRVGRVASVKFDFFRPRQLWFLPYAFMIVLFATVTLTGAVAAIKFFQHQEALANVLRGRGLAEAAVAVEEARRRLGSDIFGPVLLTAAFVGVISVFAAQRLARRLTDAQRSVQKSLEALAQGRMEWPDWVATDETGDLANGLSSVLEKLSEIPRTLGESAHKLLDAGKELAVASTYQSESIQKQAAALEQTKVTATEIHQTSLMAVQKAHDVLEVAKQLDAISEGGEEAIALIRDGMGAVQNVVTQTKERVEQLQMRAQQISFISLSVKDLADQSNMLAVNTAIEAAHSGEAGRTFRVLAQEIRGLADQSQKATLRIGEILSAMTGSIQEASHMFEASTAQLAGGLDQVSKSGEAVRRLTAIAREGTSAARQIAAAVSQQNAGVQQIFSAVGSMSEGMQRTVTQMSQTESAYKTLGQVAKQVTQLADKFQTAPS